MKLIKTVFITIVMVFMLSSLLSAEYLSPFSKIDQALEEGRLDYYDAALLRATAILRPNELPKDFVVEDAFIKSATTQLLQIKGIMENAPDYHREEWEKMRSRPALSGPAEVYITPEHEFYVHFTREGNDAPDLTDSNSSGIPDYVEYIGWALDESWNVSHTELGFITPPGDGTTGGGMDNYDAYIIRMWGTLGWCMPEGLSYDSDDFASRRISFIALSSSLNETQATSTAAHEYTHGIQFGYYTCHSGPTSAWMENHAMYMQELVFPDDDEWVDYVWWRQNRPFLALWTFNSNLFNDGSMFPYGNVIWPFFLTEYIADWDEGLVKEINVRMGLYTTPSHRGFYRQVLAEVVEEWSGDAYDIATAYNVFSTWNWLVDSNYDGSTYSQGDKFPRIPRTHAWIEHQLIPYHGTGAPAHSQDFYVQPFGSHYNVFNNMHHADHDVLRIEFHGGYVEGRPWGLSVLLHEAGQPFTAGWSIHTMVQLEEAPYEKMIMIENLTDYDRIVFIVDNARYDSDGTPGRNYEFWASYASIGPDAAVYDNEIHYYPEYPDPGDDITITARVRNIGTEAIDSGNAKFYYSQEPGVDLQLITTEAIGSLEAGEYIDLEIDWQTSSSMEFGEYFITVSLEDILPSDVDMSNNTAITNIMIGIADSGAITYRFFNQISGGHLYTISEHERDYIIDNLHDWVFEGPVYQVLEESYPGTLQAYRFFNTNTGIHLYTVSEHERDHIIDNLPEWNYEGPTFYVYETQMGNAIPVFRFFNNQRGGHLYTISEHERDVVMAMPDWNYEGIAFYVLPL